METKDNTGALFVNDRKASEKQPDRTGKALVGGKQYYVSGWLNKDRNDRPYLKLAFTLVDEAQQAPRQQYPRDRQSIVSDRDAQQSSPFGDEQHFTDDSIPF